jgi:tryptophan-rich sensory protein
MIYILSALSLITFINKGRGKPFFWPVITLYIMNGIFNAAWSYIFFTKHLPGFAVIDAGLIWVTVLLLIICTWRYSSLAGILLIPYLGWVSFATFLTYVIYKMN